MLLDNLPHLCSIKRQAYTTGESGGDEPSGDPAVSASGIACWVQPATANEILEFQKRDMVVTHAIYFQTVQDAVMGDLIVPTSGPYADQVCDFRSQVECTAGLDWGWKIMVENKR